MDYSKANMKNFWQTLSKPIYAIAPMADVTDPPYRAIIAKYGKPDVLFTEFVSADGLQSKGRGRILKDIVYSEAERPIVLQIFGSNPENFKKTAHLANKLAFDGIDINMGCPDKSVEKQGAGAALIKNPKLAQEIIRRTKEGAGNLPVSVKIRIGYSEDELNSWLPALLDTCPAAITIHLRTRQEMSKVPAHWHLAQKAVDIRNKLGSSTLILGNGDVENLHDADKKIKETCVDGVMFGRAIFGNPWLANMNIHKTDLSIKQVLDVLVEHATLYEKLLGGVKSFSIMKKHFKAYLVGFPDTKQLRISLMDAKDANEAATIVDDYERTFSGYNLGAIVKAHD